MKQIIVCILLFAICFAGKSGCSDYGSSQDKSKPVAAGAQALGGNKGGGTNAPINGWAGVLLVAGLAYGAQKIYKRGKLKLV
jgi:hypothetical protein